MSAKRKYFLKTAALLTLFFFSCSLLVRDASSTGVAFGAASVDITRPSVINIDSFDVPEYLGEIKISSKRSPEKVVIHLQDAHCNPYAQAKIDEILDHLRSKYGLSRINLEGGSGKYDLNIFLSIEDDGARKRTAKYFLEAGLVNGAEYNAIKDPAEIFLWGIEDKDLYARNLKVYRDHIEHAREVSSRIKEIESALDLFKQRIFSPGMKELDGAFHE
ncbi:MAG: hypothetical protein GF408_03045, partial [Candidatus Omnitrophica bacterium]|nr:hypothetical protein [Candidatus Omnitrophota bacterium]